jgi:predicted phage tail protein
MIQNILEFLKGSHFQTALVSAVLAAISTFVLVTWGISIDFGAIVPVQLVTVSDETPEVQEANEAQPATETEVPVETIEVFAD